MPLQTDLNQSPYFDDTQDVAVPNNYIQVLSRPGFNIQTRELNALQSILRNQIEKFGDSIYDTGTIISGCNFTFNPAYPYAKLNDQEVDGTPTAASRYLGYFVKNSANLQAFVTDSRNGFQSLDPDLMTIYLSYRNAGNNNNTHAYSAGDILTVFDGNNSIFEVLVNNAGLGFSNTNQVVFTPALVVNVTAGSFSVGQYISQPSTLANLQIVALDSVTLASAGQIILSVQPRNSDLSASVQNVAAWAVANGDAIYNVGNTGVGDVEALVGSGAGALVQTDGAGRITALPMVTQGFGYFPTLPNVRIYSPGNGSGLNSLVLAAQNFLTQVQVANTTDSVGLGYGFGVSAGVVYLKGLFLEVAPQNIIVDPYDVLPNAVAVGFLGIENIIDSNIDPSLLDNALGEPNQYAPGANRLQVVPTLTTVGTNALTNTNFFALVEWSEGNPFLQNQTTSYSALGDKIAQGINDTAGNFVVAKFSVTTRSPYLSGFEGNTFSVVVDPGTAYIGGRKIQTLTNFVIDDRKGTDSQFNNASAISLNYGNWVEIANVGGLFQFNTGDVVQFYDTAKGFLGNSGLVASANLAPVGNNIGSARARSLIYQTGLPGDPGCTYALYLFDLKMSLGQNFANVRSIAYTAGAYPGISDVVLQQNPTTSAFGAVLANSVYDSLIFPAGVETLKSVNNVVYTYRTIDQTVTMANTGILTKSVSGDPTASFSQAEPTSLTDLYLVPLSNNLIFAGNAHGSVSLNTTSNSLVGSSTSFISDFAPGDYVYLFSNSSVHNIQVVRTIVNNTTIYLDSNSSFTASGVGAYRVFPQGVPVPLGLRTGLSANVSANGNLLTINLGAAFQGSGSTNCALGVNIIRSGAGPGAKVPSRDQYVLLDLANNPGGPAGPWCLGVPDVFRLKGVYQGSNSTNTNTSSREITGSFYVDHNQNADYLDLSYLYLTPNSGLSLSASNTWLLARFDYFTTTSGGFYDSTTYVSANSAQQQITDSQALINLSSTVNSFEVPEVFVGKGGYYDLLGCLDFRPIASATATPGANVAGAPVNPVYSLSFGNTANPANDKKFPLPDSVLTADIEQYLGRIDSIFVGQDSNITISLGVPAPTRKRALAPAQPGATMLINNLIIPPYPNLPAHPSNPLSEILTTRMANINYLRTRAKRKTINPPTNPWKVESQQPVGYSMAAIGSLANRITNLEYISSLSSLETDVVSRVVPSSVDGSQDRFKYGFFTDNFSTPVSQATQDPQYMASLGADVLTPPEFSWVVRHGSGAASLQPYIDFLLIDQENATGPGVAQTAPTAPTAPVVGLSANAWLLRIDHDVLAPGAGLGTANSFVTLNDYARLQMSNTPGPVSFYFHVPPTSTDIIIFDPDQFTIYQGNTKIYDAFDSAVALSSGDKTFLASNSVPAGWFSQVTFAPLVAANGYVSGSGKIQWTHNPAGGLNYTILSTRQSPYDHWLWGLEYPIDLQPSQVAFSANGSASYSGIMAVEPQTFLLMLSKVPGEVTLISNVGAGSGGARSQIAYDEYIYGNYDLGDANTSFVFLNNNSGDVFSALTGSGSGSGLPGSAGDWNSAIANPVNTTLLDQAFGLTAYGLKPNCSHLFRVGGIDKTARCQPFGGNIGDGLISDSSGRLVFNFFYSGSTVDQDVTALLLSNTAPISVSFLTQVVADAFQPVGDGTIRLELSAPNSDAQYSMEVVADASIPLNLLRDPTK